MKSKIVLKDRKNLQPLIIKTETKYVYGGVKECGSGTRRIRVTLSRVDALMGKK